jgi:DNA repair exonuclease SbcCD ATPase subunit
VRFDHLLFENFGPHRRLEFDPSPRLTGIIGRNGTGKSTILAGLEYCLTGRSPTEGNKEDDVSDFIGAKDSCRIVANLTHGPHKLELVRAIKRATTSLKIDGGDAVEGDAKVNSEIARLLGPSASLLSDYVFVKQGLLSEFIAATPAKRGEAVAKLFQVRRANELYDALGKALTTLEVPAISAEIDNLAREIADAREALAALRVKLVTYADVARYDRDADPDVKLLARVARRTQAAIEYRTAGDDLTRALAAMEAAESTLGANQRAEDAAQQRHAAARSAMETARADMVVHNHDVQVQAKRKVIFKNMARLEQEQKSEPVRPVSYADFSTGSPSAVLLHDLEISVTAHESFLSDLNGTAVCPTCHTRTTEGNLAASIAQARRELPGQRTQLLALREQRRVSVAYDHDMAVWQRDCDELYRRHEALQRELATLPEASGRDIDVTACAAADATYLAAVEELQKASNRVAFSVAEVAGFRRDVNRLRKLRADIKATMPEKVEVGDINAARARLDTVAQRLAARGELVGSIKAGNAALKAREATLARLEDEKDRGNKARALRARIEAIRAVCEHSALPRQVARANLAPIEAKINLMLDRFEANFRVTGGEDLAFTAKFHSGPRMGAVQPVKRLSKGQKALFALAYRCEVNSQFVGDVGLLCLDEPTDSLDRANVGCLDVALTAIREVADSRGLQCWLVTHEPALGSLFDSVVHLD